MELQIDWSQIISYVLGAGGAVILGHPVVKRVLGWIKTLRLPKVPVTAGSEDEEVMTVEEDTAMVLLESAFVFQSKGNQVGVDKCLDAINQLTMVPLPKESKPQ